ncbi:heme peroxidase [Nemania serpens]|nr:heme peroxidase [Nemania serpens]
MDATYSLDSTSEDLIIVPMPEYETMFPLDKKFGVRRTAAVPGTSTLAENSRESVNMATAWLDNSALYGSTVDVAKALRSYEHGKLITQEVEAPGTSPKAAYLPFNTMGVPTNTRPGVGTEHLFAGGDPRTNKDWLLLTVHTLLLREHSRLSRCSHRPKSI